RRIPSCSSSSAMHTVILAEKKMSIGRRRASRPTPLPTRTNSHCSALCSSAHCPPLLFVATPAHVAARFDVPDALDVPGEVAVLEGASAFLGDAHGLRGVAID